MPTIIWSDVTFGRASLINSTGASTGFRCHWGRLYGVLVRRTLDGFFMYVSYISNYVLYDAIILHNFRFNLRDCILADETLSQLRVHPASEALS
jgi:hypothetical protein